ncbi:type 1 fimbrial protein [Enterobacter cloacae]|nr:type 1 fimbrial protein [Enterobacter cloacae]
MKTNSAGGQQRPLKPWRNICAGCALLVTGVLLPETGGAVSIYVHGNLVDGTCEVTLVSNPEIDMGKHVLDEFTDNAGTASITSIALWLDNCNNVNAGQGAVGLKVTGSTLSGESTIFNNDPTDEVGFMLRENGVSSREVQPWTGAIQNFWDKANAVSNNTVTFSGVDPTVQEGIILNYGVGFVSKSQTVKPADPQKTVSASLTFTFNYQ